MKVKLLEKEIFDAQELKENGFDFDKEYEVFLTGKLDGAERILISVKNGLYRFSNCEYEIVAT